MAGTGGSARVHMRDGSVYNLSSWRRDGERLRGRGAHYDVERRPVREGAFSIDMANIAVVEMGETQVRGTDVSVAAMSVVTAGSIGVSAYCAMNSKACFGSCPTFYVARDGAWTVQAEGFSTSVARSLEASDLDDMPDAAPQDGALVVAMRNEAIETHVTRNVALRVVDAPEGSVAYRRFDTERFDALGSLSAPVAVDEGVTLSAFAARDGDEYAPVSDGVDLAHRASVTLRYPAPGSVARRARPHRAQQPDEHLRVLSPARPSRTKRPRVQRRARAQRPRDARRARGFDRALGGVDVEVHDPDGAWRHVATLPYIGPIARATRAAAFKCATPRRPSRCGSVSRGRTGASTPRSSARWSRVIFRR